MAQQTCNQFESNTNTSSATICKWCGQEKFLHTPKVGYMAQQKLYTEEQVRLLLDLGKLKLNGEMYSKDVLLQQVAPIELPSDDEIRKRGWEDADAEDDIAFFVGAKWMKEQILNQNK